MQRLKTDPLRDLRLVSLGSTAEALAISKRTLHRLIAAGDFPKPIKVGAASRVRLADIERYLERRQARGDR